MTSKPESRLFTKKYRTISQIKGPLLFIERVTEAGYEEIVEVFDPNGEVRRGRLLEIDGQTAVAQLFVGTDGLDLDHTTVHFTGDVFRMDVSLTMLGRVFDGAGQPIDGGPAIIADESLDINGLPINPSMREEPREFIQTGISTIDGLNTLTRGQKLPVFSGSGLPGNKLLAQITEQARVPAAKEADEPFAVVFGAIGITHREASFFMDRFKASGAMDRTVVFINQANDPTIERLLTPRMALTAAEYLAFKHHRQVLVILTDMTNYCEALRELAAAREEVPGRRGYPGYMYSDLASIYERAGRVRENPGSVTQLILLTMPDDDITHPIPDLTGYITEGQIVLSRDLHRKGIFPPIDVLPSLSRLMDKAIGEGLTRADHRAVADQLYAFYAEGRDLRRLVEIIGESALSNEDQQIMAFTDRFEREFVGQGRTNRDIETTMRFAWEHLSSLPEKSLKRISRDFIDKFYQKNGRE